MKASDLLVRALENEGVEYIFGLPGEENLDLLESIRQSDIKLIITRHEQAAGFMAATYGRLTGKTGVCLTTLGPGATNLVTAAAYAQLGGYPMLVLTGQKPIKKHKQGKFQVLDVVEMMKPLVKNSEQVKHGALIPATIRQSFRLTEEERPGVVHLEIPEDIAEEKAEGHLFKSDAIIPTIADPSAIEKAAKLIGVSKHPLILIGAGANRKTVGKPLAHFIETTGIPFFTTQMGKGVVDEHHPLNMGTAAISEHDFVHAAIDKADLIINFGHDIVEKPPFFMQNGRMKVIHIHFFPASVDEVYFPDCEVIGDIPNTIEKLTGTVKPRKWDFSQYYKIRELFEGNLKQAQHNDTFPMSCQRLVAEVQEALPANGIITLDNGMYKIWFARNFLCHRRDNLLLDNALASMGAGLPSGVAAALLKPDRPVIAVCGDGGFMMNSQELETAMRLGVNLIVLILRDNAYGMIKWKQRALRFDDFGLDFSNPDFVKYAESFGARGHTITRTSELSTVLKECLNNKGLQVIDVPVDYSENDRFLTRELPDLTKGL